MREKYIRKDRYTVHENWKWRARVIFYGYILSQL